MAMRPTHRTQSQDVRYACDCDISVVLNNFQNRNWTEVDPREHWNVFWASTASTRTIFSVEHGIRLCDDQVKLFFAFYHISKENKPLSKSLRADA